MHLLRRRDVVRVCVETRVTEENIGGGVFNSFRRQQSLEVRRLDFPCLVALCIEVKGRHARLSRMCCSMRTAKALVN